MSKKSVLGRGLGALIESAEDESNRLHDLSEQENNQASRASVNTEIELDKIITNPFQPRTYFDEDLLNELAESIKIHGLIQPITLRESDDGKYQIISGERRFRASKLAGLTAIPAYIRKAGDQEMLEMALIENIQREDLDAIEIAISYQRLVDECKLTQENLGERVGKKRTTVTNYLRLLKLPSEIQKNIRERKISMGHARALVSVENAKIQNAIAKRIINDGISVRQTEELVKKQNEPKAEKQQVPHGEELPEKYCALIELLELHFNNQINIKRNDKGEGSITISFTSDDEVQQFIDNLSKQ